MTKANIRAYCRECKRWASDDLINYGEGLKNTHEHPLTLFRQVGKELMPDGTMLYITDLTAEAYLRDASRLDAELIVKAIRRIGSQGGEGSVLKLVPDSLLYTIATQIISGLRQMAVEDEQKHRQAKIKSKVKEPKQERVEEPLA